MGNGLGMSPDPDDLAGMIDPLHARVTRDLAGVRHTGDDLRVLTGGSLDEVAARARPLGLTVDHVEHVVERAGESLALTFFNGVDGQPSGTLTLAAPRDRPGVLLATWTPA
jgi:hypothetical protein